MERQYNDKKTKKGLTMIHKILHRKLRVEQHNPLKTRGGLWLFYPLNKCQWTGLCWTTTGNIK